MVYCDMGSSWGVSRDTAARRAALCPRHGAGGPAIRRDTAGWAAMRARPGRAGWAVAVHTVHLASF